MRIIYAVLLGLVIAAVLVAALLFFIVFPLLDTFDPIIAGLAAFGLSMLSHISYLLG